MNFQEGTYKHFDSFKEVIKDWSLDFTILSKGDFSAYFKMATNEKILLTRETLNGTIEHSGVSPIGFRTLVIPVNKGVEFIWFNKKVNGNEILIFPKNNEIDVVTFDGLDIHLISIEETFLYEIIKQNSFTNCQKIFEEESLEILLTEEFSNQFFELANRILNSSSSGTEQRDQETTNLISTLLNYLESTSVIEVKKISSKKNFALIEGVEAIQKEKEILYTIPQLCEKVGLSERSLYNAFKEKYGISPGDFIRAVRLNKAREDLYKYPELKVSEIAGKYHFWHMGQFAKDFKIQFGVLPSEIKSKK